MLRYWLARIAVQHGDEPVGITLVQEVAMSARPNTNATARRMAMRCLAVPDSASVILAPDYKHLIAAIRSAPACYPPTITALR
jgi:hypothetical protein